jgi:hypothetical protein
MIRKKTVLLLLSLIIACASHILGTDYSKTVYGAEQSIKKYRVLVQGTNFLIPINNELVKCGFYTTRYVEAKNAKEAEYKAMDILRGTKRLKDIVKNDAMDPPVMNAEEIVEIESFAGIENLEPGFAWYKKD